MIDEETYDLYNKIHATSRPFFIETQQQQQQQQQVGYANQFYNNELLQLQQQQQQQQRPGEGPMNPMEQITGTRQPFQVSHLGNMVIVNSSTV